MNRIVVATLTALALVVGWSCTQADAFADHVAECSAPAIEQASCCQPATETVCETCTTCTTCSVSASHHAAGPVRGFLGKMRAEGQSRRAARQGLRHSRRSARGGCHGVSTTCTSCAW